MYTISLSNLKYKQMHLPKKCGYVYNFEISEKILK